MPAFEYVKPKVERATVKMLCLYGRGKSEIYLGKALAGIPRDKYVLATKVGRRLGEEPIGFDYSRDAVLRNLEESLNRLQLDAVDILQHEGLVSDRLDFSTK